jgi:putative intracellular protease/amidase
MSCGGRRITGFNLTDQYPDLAVQPEAEAAGATWVNAAVVMDGNLITSRHPDEAVAFAGAILSSLDGGACRRTNSSRRW